ncbi:hypothetical protein GCM10028807_26920 [Spirosoma daeguense]
MKNITMFITITLIVFFSVYFAHAALPKPIWQSGKIVLQDNTVLEGDLVYNWLVETVQLRQPDGRIRLFTTYQVRQFSWFDIELNKRRDFMALTNAASKETETSRFYEVIMDGPLAVVRKLKRPRGLWKRAISHPIHFNDQVTLAQNTDLFDYYVHDAGKLLSLDRYYTDVYKPLMTTYAQQIQQYTIGHNINDRVLLGRLLLISHYNTLVEQSSSTASVRNLIPAQE